MNKVISRKYVEKNYIHKDIIKELIKILESNYPFAGSDDKGHIEYTIDILNELLRDRIEIIEESK